MKAAHLAGISTRDFVFIASSTTVLMAVFWVNGESAIFSGRIPAPQVLWTAIVAAILLSLGFINLNRALDQPLGLASVVLVITSANPLIVSFLSMIFLDEAKKIHLPMFVPGALLIAAGTILVALSTKSR